MNIQHHKKNAHTLTYDTHTHTLHTHMNIHINKYSHAQTTHTHTHDTHTHTHTYIIYKHSYTLICIYSTTRSMGASRQFWRETRTNLDSHQRSHELVESNGDGCRDLCRLWLPQRPFWCDLMYMYM